MKVTWSKKAKKDDSESSNLVRNPINKFSQNKMPQKLRKIMPELSNLYSPFDGV